MLATCTRTIAQHVPVFFGDNIVNALELTNFKQHGRGFLDCLVRNAAKEERIRTLRTLRRLMQWSQRRCQCYVAFISRDGR